MHRAEQLLALSYFLLACLGAGGVKFELNFCAENNNKMRPNDVSS